MIKKESECQRDLSISILPTDEVSVTNGGTFGRGAPPDVMPHEVQVISHGFLPKCVDEDIAAITTTKSNV